MSASCGARNHCLMQAVLSSQSWLLLASRPFSDSHYLSPLLLSSPVPTPSLAAVGPLPGNAPLNPYSSHPLVAPSFPLTPLPSFLMYPSPPVLAAVGPLPGHRAGGQAAAGPLAGGGGHVPARAVRHGAGIRGWVGGDRGGEGPAKTPAADRIRACHIRQATTCCWWATTVSRRCVLTQVSAPYTR